MKVHGLLLDRHVEPPEENDERKNVGVGAPLRR
jgi:hypothetical protein